MELEIIEAGMTHIATLTTHERIINTVQDATDLLGNADYQGARSIMLHETNLHPEFFDLQTGFAGEILQKYSNYRMKLAIIGEFDKFKSHALQAFIVECNRGNSIFFVSDADAAMKKLLES